MNVKTAQDDVSLVTPVTVSVKPNFFLDLDQTIISGEPSENMKRKKDKMKRAKLFKYHNMDNYYMIFERPHLQEFLDYLFANFNVSVWTAASKDYALFIIKNIIIGNHPNRRIDYLFFDYHCDAAYETTKNTKKLELLWDLYKLPGYNKENTVILDDYKDDVYDSQPEICILAKEFKMKRDKSEHDDFLKRLTAVLQAAKRQGTSDMKSVVKIANNELNIV